MKEFINKSTLFIIPIIILLYPLDIVLSEFYSNRHSTSYIADEFSVWNDIYDGQINSEIAIYGSSRAWRHFNSTLMTDSLGIKTYNFGINGNNFWLQHLRHIEYLKHNIPPKVIILSVDYSTLEKRENLYNINQFLPYMLWNKDIQDYTISKSNFKRQDYQIPLIRYMGKAKFMRLGIFQALGLSGQAPRRERGFSANDVMWDDALNKAREKFNRLEIIVDDNLVEMLDDFIKKCIDNNITVLMVYSPTYYEGLEFISNHKEYYNLLKSYADKYNLDFLDYTNDEMCYNKHYFYNSTHLNKIGADLFTRKLIQDLKTTDTYKRLQR